MAKFKTRRGGRMYSVKPLCSRCRVRNTNKRDPVCRQCEKNPAIAAQVLNPSPYAERKDG